jgi:hypothetical protein
MSLPVEATVLYTYFITVLPCQFKLMMPSGILIYFLKMLVPQLVTLGAAGAGTVVGTPIANAAFGSSVFGWITLKDGETVEKVTFSTKDFSCAGAEGDVVTARYYALDSASRSLTIRADMVPSIAYLVMEAQLCSSDVATNVIGKVQIIVPKASFTGAFTISMTPDSVASTPLSVRAFRTDMLVNGVMTPVLATITEIVTNSHWYDQVVGLSVVNGDQALATRTGTKTLDIRAIPLTGAAFKPPYADLDFVSGTVGTATVSAAGLVQGVGAGTTLINIKIHDKVAIDTSVTITVP